MTERYNGNLILMFHSIYFRCEDMKGTKYEFFKQLKDLGAKNTIYRFLNFLESNQALEPSNNGTLKINKKVFRELFYSDPDGQKAYDLIKKFSTLILK